MIRTTGEGRAGQGQARSLLRRGAPASTCSREGRVQVWESRIDLAAVGQAVARVMRGQVGVAEADDEVQAQVIREWLSGRGLPACVAEAHRELRQRVVQRMLSDLRGDRRGQLAGHRRDLRAMNAWRDSTDASADSDDTSQIDVIAQAPAVWGSATRADAAVDAASLVQVALRPGGPWCARDADALAVMVGELTDTEIAAERGVTREAVSLARRGFAEQLRAWATRRRILILK